MGAFQRPEEHREERLHLLLIFGRAEIDHLHPGDGVAGDIASRNMEPEQAPGLAPVGPIPMRGEGGDAERLPRLEPKVPPPHLDYPRPFETAEQNVLTAAVDSIPVVVAGAREVSHIGGIYAARQRIIHKRCYDKRGQHDEFLTGEPLSLASIQHGDIVA